MTETTASLMFFSTILLAVEDMGPNPIAPEGKELFWGAGTFLVFLFVMQVFLVPKVRAGMAARYGRFARVTRAPRPPVLRPAATSRRTRLPSPRFAPRPPRASTTPARRSMPSVKPRSKRRTRASLPSVPRQTGLSRRRVQPPAARSPRQSAA